MEDLEFGRFAGTNISEGKQIATFQQQTNQMPQAPKALLSKSFKTGTVDMDIFQQIEKTKPIEVYLHSF